MTDDLPVPTRYFDALPLLDVELDRIRPTPITRPGAFTPPAHEIASPTVTLQGGRDDSGGPPPAAAAAVALTAEEQERLDVLRERSIERRRTKVAENQYVISKGPR